MVEALSHDGRVVDKLIARHASVAESMCLILRFFFTVGIFIARMGYKTGRVYNNEWKNSI